MGCLSSPFFCYAIACFLTIQYFFVISPSEIGILQAFPFLFRLLLTRKLSFQKAKRAILHIQSTAFPNFLTNKVRHDLPTLQYLQSQGQSKETETAKAAIHLT